MSIKSSLRDIIETCEAGEKEADAAVKKFMEGKDPNRRLPVEENAAKEKLEAKMRRFAALKKDLVVAVARHADGLE